MRVTDACRFVLIVAGAGLIIASAPTNADAAGGRSAAVQRCMARANASVDLNLGGVETQRRHTAVYRSCMHQAGFRP